MYPGPGTPESDTPTKILAVGEYKSVIGVTIKSGEGVLAKGVVLGIETASKKYVAYDDSASDGSEVAKAILSDKVDATSKDQLVAVYLLGIFVKANLTGCDAAAIVDLKAREVGDYLVV